MESHTSVTTASLKEFRKQMERKFTEQKKDMKVKNRIHI